MTAQEALIHLTKGAIDTLFSTLNATPEDKLTWKASETNRTPMELLDEIHSTIPWNTAALRTQKMSGEFSGPKLPATMAEIETSTRALAEELYAAILAFPDANLMDTLELPWGTMSFLEIMAYPYWNTMYHVGQVNFIQLMHGDTEMH